MRLIRFAFLLCIFFVFVCGYSANAQVQKKYYAYKDGGEWHNVLTWTEDPTGETLIPAGGAGIPDNNAIVSIASNVYLTSDVLSQNLRLTIESAGTLDLRDKQFRNPLFELSGRGVLLIASNVFPKITAFRPFLEADGGTVRFNVQEEKPVNIVDFSSTFWNLEFLGKATYAYRVQDNKSLNVYNNLFIGGQATLLLGGIPAVPDGEGTNFSRKRIIIQGDLSVSAGASLRTIEGSIVQEALDSRVSGLVPYERTTHILELEGNFTNNGTVRLHNVPNLDFARTLANQHNVTLVASGAKSTLFQCNGVTDLYALVVKKGSDRATELRLSASDRRLFRLYGPNSKSNFRALNLQTGTLRLLNKACVASFSERDSYVLSSHTALVLDGAGVLFVQKAQNAQQVADIWGLNVADVFGISTVTATTDKVNVELQGLLHIKNGTYAVGDGAIITGGNSADAELRVEGGQLFAPQIVSVGVRLKYQQTGGTVILRGRRADNNVHDYASTVQRSRTYSSTYVATPNYKSEHGTLSLQRELDIFEQTGGELRIVGAANDNGSSYVVEIKASRNEAVAAAGKVIIDLSGLTETPMFQFHAVPLLGDLEVSLHSDAQELRLDHDVRLLGAFLLKKGKFNLASQQFYFATEFVVGGGELYADHGGICANVKEQSLFKVVAPGSIRDNKLRMFTSETHPQRAAGERGTLLVDGNLSLTVDYVRANSSTDIQLDTHAHLIITKELNLWANLLGGSCILENGVTISSSGGCVDNVILAENAQVNARNSFFYINKRLTLSEGSSLYIGNGSKEIVLDKEATIVSLGAGNRSGYIYSDGMHLEKGIRKIFGDTEDISAGYAIPFKYIVNGNLVDRTLTLLSVERKLRDVVVSYVNVRHPMLRDGLPFYIKVNATNEQSLTNLKLTISNPETTLPSDYKVFKLLNNQWVQIGETPTTALIEFPIQSRSDYVVGRQNQIISYVSIQDGNWNLPTTWSPAGVPQLGDKVLIRHKVTVAPVLPTYPDNSLVCGYVTIDATGQLEIPQMNMVSIDRILGEGKLRLRLDSDNAAYNKFANEIDFQNFLKNKPYGTIEYYMDKANAEVLLPDQLIQYGNLICSYEQANQVFVVSDQLKSQMQVLGFTQLKNPTNLAGAIFSFGGIAKKYSSPCNVSFKDRLDVQNVALHFTNPLGSQKHLVYMSKTQFVGSSQIDITGANVDERCGNIYFYSDLELQTNAPLSFANNRGYLTVRFEPVNDAGLRGNNPFRCRQSFVKSSKPTTVFTVENVGGIVCTEQPSNSWFNLERGILHLKSAFTFLISTEKPFTIAKEAEIRVDNENLKVQICSAGVLAGKTALILEGKLLMLRGVVEVGSPLANSRYGDLEYAANAPANLEVHGGELLVHGRIRPPENVFTATIEYTQTGGKVIVAPENSPVGSAGIDLTGSNFRMTGGELIYAGFGGRILDGGDVRIVYLSSNVTGGTIRLTGGAAGKQVLFSSNVKLYNLSCEGSAQKVVLWEMPLEVVHELRVATGSEFLPQRVDLTLGGALVCDGKFNGEKNKTIFNGTHQTISGNAAQLVFKDVEVQTVGSLIYQVALAAEQKGNLSINNAGILDLGTRQWRLNGNLLNDGEFTTSGTGVLHLVGTNRSELRGNGNYGSFSVKKNAGAIAKDNIKLHGTLALENGNFILDRYLLHIFRGGKIDRGTTSYYIVTSGSFVAQGIKQELAFGDQSILFPLGLEGNKYTPALLTIAAPGYAQNDGYVRVVNINNTFGVVGDCRQKVLNYHWEVESQNQTLTGQLEFSCPTSFKAAQMSVSESAPLCFQPSAQWMQQTKDNLSESGTTLKVVWQYANASSLSGRYTAGPPLCFLMVKEVESVAAGRWSDPIWKTYNSPTSLPLSLPDGPNGLTVHLKHEVLIDANNSKAKAVVFETGGVLKVASTAMGVNLGAVSGTGTLQIEKGELPQGDYTKFFGCANSGKLVLAGTTNYTLPDVAPNEYPYLWLTGSGKRSMPAADITVCKELFLKGTTVYDNTLHNKGLRLLGSIERESGASFHAGTGADAWVWLKGDVLQEVGGTGKDFQGANAFNHLYVENGKGVNIREGGVVEVKGLLRLKNGKVKVPRNSPTTKFRIYASQSNVTPADLELHGHSLSYVDGPLYVVVAAGVSEYRFPLGVGVTLANQMILKALTPGEVCIEASLNPETGMNPPLRYVDLQRTWKVSGTVPSAKIMIVLTGFDWSLNTSDPDLRIVKLGSVAPIRWSEITSDVFNDFVSDRQVSTRNVETLSASHYQQYTLGTTQSIIPTVVFADLLSKYCIPVGGKVRVPLTINFSGNWADYLPIRVTYKIDGATQNLDIPVTSQATEPFYIEVDYSVGANPAKKFAEVQIARLVYKYGTSSRGFGQNGSETVKVSRMPDINAGTYTLCFTKGSSVLLNGSSQPSGVVEWSSTGLQGVFANRDNLNTTYTLGETGATLQLKLKVDNEGCVAEKNATLLEATPPVGNIVGLASVCANGGVDVVELYTFTPAQPGYSYEWSLEDKPVIADLDLVAGTQTQNPMKINWSHVGVLPTDLAYKARVHLKVTDANSCISTFDYPVQVIIKLATAPLYHLPYNQ